MTPTHRSRRGFSAIEVLGTVALIGVALVPVLDLAPAGTRQAAFTEHYVQARALLEHSIDEWVEAAAAAPAEPAVERETQVPFARGEGAFRLRVTAAEVENRPGLWAVSAHVTWTFPAGKEHELETSRLHCNPHLSLMTEPLEDPASDEGRENT